MSTTTTIKPCPSEEHEALIVKLFYEKIKGESIAFRSRITGHKTVLSSITIVCEVCKTKFVYGSAFDLYVTVRAMERRRTSMRQVEHISSLVRLIRED